MPISDERDRLGDKLHDLGKAREDLRAAERDRELLATLRKQAEERLAGEKQPEDRLRVFSRVLCAIDFEGSSLKALDLAGQIARQNGAELYLIHVCPTVMVPLGGPVTNPVMTEQAATEKLARVAAQHLRDIHSQLLVTTGDAAERVINAQSALGVDLIVMGTHGRRGLERFFLGSVAERVIREAGCRVLTLR